MNEESFLRVFREALRRANAALHRRFWINSEGSDDKGQKHSVFIFVSSDTESSNKARRVLAAAGLLSEAELNAYKNLN